MQRGFSLVETIIATGVMTAALVSVAQFVGAAVESGAAARTRTATTLMAEQKMEQLRAMPWADIAAPPAAATDYLDAAGNVRCADAPAPCTDAVYVRRWRALPASFSTGVVLIDVEVGPVGKGHGKTTLVTARARMTP